MIFFSVCCYWRRFPFYFQRLPGGQKAGTILQPPQKWRGRQLNVGFSASCGLLFTQDTTNTRCAGKMIQTIPFGTYLVSINANSQIIFQLLFFEHCKTAMTRLTRLDSSTPGGGCRAGFGDCEDTQHARRRVDLHVAAYMYYFVARLARSATS